MQKSFLRIKFYDKDITVPLQFYIIYQIAKLNIDRPIIGVIQTHENKLLL